MRGNRSLMTLARSAAVSIVRTCAPSGATATVHPPITRAGLAVKDRKMRPQRADGDVEASTADADRRRRRRDRVGLLAAAARDETEGSARNVQRDLFGGRAGIEHEPVDDQQR